jgi:hypothetical protein
MNLAEMRSSEVRNPKALLNGLLSGVMAASGQRAQTTMQIH